MEFLNTTIMQALSDFLLPFLRVGGMLIAMVGLSARTVPATVRNLLAVFITLCMMPLIPPSPFMDLASSAAIVEMIKQLVIGVTLGFITALVIDTFILAGQIIAMQTGLGFASIVDPLNGVSVPAVGQFYLILATLLFWAIDGHLAMIQMVSASFVAFPIGGAWFEPEQFRQIAHWGAWLFITAVTLALAPIVSLLIVNLAFGVMTKASPQMNIFTIGFSIAQIMGLVIIFLTLDNFIAHFANQWERGQAFMCQLVNVCG
jgi:flagellar biosynthetic protein FliR